MGQTFSKLLFHIIFSTKERMPYLGPLREDLFPYMGGIIRGIRGKAININGANDHVHILTFLPTNVSVAEAVLQRLDGLLRLCHRRDFDA